MALVGNLFARGPSGFGYNSTAEQVSEGLDLTGKTYLLTGAGSGLGQETMRVLVLRGARVLATGRTLEKATEAAAPFGDKVTPLACELAEPASVRACIEQVKALGVPLDGILTNAGIMALPKLELAHGYELQFFTNHIGHFILVTGLLDQLAPAGRVVILSSAAHKNPPKAGIDFDNLKGEGKYSAWAAYGRSKLANALFARELNRRLAPKGQLAVALHPGVIPTNLVRHMNPVLTSVMAVGKPLFLKTVPQGAATTVFAATHPDAAQYGGGYLDCCAPGKPSAHATDDALASRLWDVSERIAAEV